MKKVESEALAWDYKAFKEISKASGANRVTLRRSIMRLAETLGIEFRGIKPKGRLKNGKTQRCDSTSELWVLLARMLRQFG